MAILSGSNTEQEFSQFWGDEEAGLEHSISKNRPRQRGRKQAEVQSRATDKLACSSVRPGF